MKFRLLRCHWTTLSILAVSVLACLGAASDAMVAAQAALAKTKLELQQQGFKTDLTNFDFSTSPELRAREASLAATLPANRKAAPFYDHPDLMESTGRNKVIVVWQQASVWRSSASGPDAEHELSWDDFADAVNQNQPEVDAACAAILSGPIQFNLDASAGNAMRLPHLALLKNLSQTLNDRAMLALHAGNREAAWSNLMAATRLVTAWNTEPAQVSYGVRFGMVKLAVNATWQALQTNGWTDDQLARLQHEWETADFLSRLPEIQAFQRASDAKMFELEEPASPSGADTATAEERLLDFYRDREIEYRNAIQAGNWRQMRGLPGVTNEPLFHAPMPQRGHLGMMLNQRQIRMQLEARGTCFLGRAAEAETERRIVIAALALERCAAKHGLYPEKLAGLVPEFLKAEPLDFMTGQPLHYQLVEDGHLLLYSVGLDGVDNGGTMPTTADEAGRNLGWENPNRTVLESDMVWPPPASSARVVAFRKAQGQAEAERQAQREAAARVEAQLNAQRAAEMRQAAMKKLLAEKPSLGPEPTYQGKPLSAWVDQVGQIERFNGAPDDAVAAIRAIGSKAVPFLLEWMPHPGAERPVDGFPDWSDINLAWWALGTEGKSAIPALARILNRPPHGMDDYSVWTETAKAISYLGPDAIAPMLKAASKMAGQHELWELLHNFANLGTNGAPAVPALIRWANDPDYWVRDGVVSALGGIGKRPDLAVPILMKALQHDPNSMVRRDAAEALGNFAKDSKTVLPELIKTLKDSDWEAREGALTGLGQIQSKPEVVVPLIAPFLYDDNNVIQRSAAYALRDLGNAAGYRALLQATNAAGIGDILYEVSQRLQPDKSR